MFETKKQLKEEIARLKLDINLLEMDKEIAVNQLKIADGEIRNAKAVADYWKDKFKNSPTAINKHNEFLIKHITSDNSRLDEKNKNLEEENKKLIIQTNIKDNYIKRLEKEVLKQKQTIKDKDEYIAFLQGNFNLNIRTTLQNSQFKDKLNRISAILNED